MRTIFSNRSILADIRKIAHLPLVSRLTHAKGVRVLTIFSASMLMATGCSAVAGNAETLSHVVPVNHYLIDAMAYLIHAITTVPIVKYAEPFVMLLTGASE